MVLKDSTHRSTKRLLVSLCTLSPPTPTPSSSLRSGVYERTWPHSISCRNLENDSNLLVPFYWASFTHTEYLRLISNFQATTCNFFPITLFAAKGRMNYVTIAMVIFLHVKITCYFSRVQISCFCTKAHLVFHHGVYIIKVISCIAPTTPTQAWSSSSTHVLEMTTPLISTL